MIQSNLPVPVGPVIELQDERSGARTFAKPQSKAGVVDAQLLGQEGARRGLKGGPPVLDAARAAYLDAEFSGEADRRPPVGILKVREI
ncbi:MAG: hypothetical protein B7Y99_08775 [Caulobacterales bacterium 32-69-10]|nr:MAG: hypothetical protein B7Y99_08775 [Caulobacterales bacterium 32-69-10]